MKKIILLFCFLIPISTSAQKINEGMSKINSYISSFKTTANEFGFETRFVLAIGFPETTRSSWHDGLEETANEQIYVRWGSNYSDYSIGLFQTKPSWAEKIERDIEANANLSNKFSCLKYKQGLSEAEMRSERVQRLSSPKIQFIYLCAFTALMNEWYGWKYQSDEARISFYASAYNVGYGKTAETIETIGAKPQFPWNQNNYWRYKECALEFYNSEQAKSL